MPDNRNDPGPQDGKLISLREPHEVAYWTEALGVTHETLSAAVAAAGPSAQAVRDWLRDGAGGPQGEDVAE